mmetsp:Transcript_37795/g.84285  ORF Transcript_37795/g.84285 Transcript_37795/m.84285 type:complete len:224 (+) Transcript_37795:150-821(+)|eukprot:CAMPEP_0202906018 /NCGR_PEP_ID=MMETSP1392-20130828/37030_1 /ASSEMBLY_ACC=CAM_ASM_000868 /TAXON_ID=225041 /ORGANISM="Chlamydomonas chlamydogama, Strain SAG 11-48b" /LENGTH=223 /DNA_ID=CAMNT_0049594357 /DNA_START=127 /DNA_END=798 /DNA_ORIENTATION=-
MSMVPHGRKAASVDNTARRVWDKDEFRQKAKEREEKEQDKEESALDIRKRKRLERDPLHQGLIVARSNLQQRNYQIDLSARLGKTQVVGLNTPLSQQAGYYCSVCDCILRDSQSYLDHINGKWHNRALGMTMRVEKSTVDQIKNKLEDLKNKKNQAKDDDYLPDGVDKRILEAQEAEEREREERKAKKREKKQQSKEEADDAGDVDPDMMALMGFSGFGGSKK